MNHPPINLYSLPRVDWIDNPDKFKLHSKYTANYPMCNKSVNYELIKQATLNR